MIEVLQSETQDVNIHIALFHRKKAQVKKTLLIY